MDTNKKLVLFSMISIVKGLRLSMFIPTMYYYFLDIFHNDAIKANAFKGYVSATYAIGGILGSLSLGILLDNYNVLKELLLFSIFTVAFESALYLLPIPPMLLLTGKFMVGFGLCCTSAVAQVEFSKCIGERRTAKCLTIVYGVGLIGSLVGGLLAMFVFPKIDFYFCGLRLRQSTLPAFVIFVYSCVTYVCIWCLFERNKDTRNQITKIHNLSEKVTQQQYQALNGRKCVKDTVDELSDKTNSDSSDCDNFKKKNYLKNCFSLVENRRFLMLLLQTFFINGFKVLFAVSVPNALFQCYNLGAEHLSAIVLVCTFVSILYVPVLKFLLKFTEELIIMLLKYCGILIISAVQFLSKDRFLLCDIIIMGYIYSLIMLTPTLRVLLGARIGKIGLNELKATGQGLNEIILLLSGVIFGILAGAFPENRMWLFIIVFILAVISTALIVIVNLANWMKHLKECNRQIS